MLDQPNPVAQTAEERLALLEATQDHLLWFVHEVQWAKDIFAVKMLAAEARERICEEVGSAAIA